jgi:hypothetical protein
MAAIPPFPGKELHFDHEDARSKRARSPRIPVAHEDIRPSFPDARMIEELKAEILTLRIDMSGQANENSRTFPADSSNFQTGFVGREMQSAGGHSPRVGTDLGIRRIPSARQSPRATR